MKIEKIFSYFITNGLRIRLRPETLQMPITGKCNSKCTTCNVWKQKEKKDVDIDELKKTLQDEYFKNVRYVGINGGEPFLHSRFCEVIETILKIKKLKAIYIITNGLATDRTLNMLSSAKKMCKKRGVKINLTVSMDGVGEVYECVRGIKNSFKNVENTILAINSDLNRYCDSITIGTTISKRNVGYLSQIRTYADIHRIKVNYHLAVPNRRIYTAENEDYSVLHVVRNRMLATEFFFGEYKYSTSWKSKLLYYQNFKFLLNKGMKRCSVCNYQKQDLTLDEHLNIYYCAKESKAIGKASDTPIRMILKSKQAKEELKRIKKCCNQCGHYITMPSISGFWGFCTELLKPGVWIFYKILCTFGL